MERYKEYKNSGVQWLGEIPRHWKCLPIRRVANVNPHRKRDLALDDYVGYAPMERIRCDIFNPTKIQVKDLTSGLTYCEQGDVVLAKVTPCFENGNVAIVSEVENGCCFASSELFVFRVKKYINTRYLFYTFLNKGFVNAGASTMRGTGGLKRVTTEFVNSAPMPLPPLSEQERIVHFLDINVAKINLYVADKEKEIQLLNELKESEIANAVTQGLNHNVKMKDSGISWIGMIPEHWEVKRVASLFTGKVELNTDFRYQHAFKFNYGTLVPKEEVGDVEEYRSTYVKYSLIKKNDILINGLNLNYDFVSQRVAIAPEDGIITSAYIVVRPRENTNSAYYTLLFKTMDNKKLFHGMGTGIRLTLSFEELKKQVVVEPPLDEQRTIVAHIENKCSKINSLISELGAEIEYLKEYKQSLIADCVTGQINVQNM